MNSFLDAKKRFFLFLFCCHLLQCFSVHAVIFLNPEEGQESVQQLEKRTHVESSKFPAVCFVASEYESRKEKGSFRSHMGTGIYFRNDPVNKKGYILTVGHILFDPDKFVGKVFISFDPSHRFKNDKLDIDPSMRIHATRFLVHPKLKWNIINEEGFAKSGLHRGLSADLAVLEFDLSALPEGIQPLPLYEGKGYKSKPFLDAIIVGYGAFGTNRTPLEFLAKRHLGRTFVTYNEEFLAAPLFYQILFTRHPEKHPLRFEPSRFVNRELKDDFNSEQGFQNSEEFIVRPHPQQSLAVSGDSGSPLIFLNQGKFKVAGIMSSTVSMSLAFPNIDKTLQEDLKTLITNLWVPIPIQRNWIEETVKLFQTEKQ